MLIFKRFVICGMQCILSASLVIILLSCGRGTGAPATGSISFGLQFQNPNAGQGKAVIAYAPTGNPCSDYGIATVQGYVNNASNAQISSGGPWQCSDRQGTFTAVPAGSGYTVVFEGLVSGAVVWRGQATNLSVSNGQNTPISTPVAMIYIGGDTTPPAVSSVTPPQASVNVPVASAIISAVFNEDMSPTTFDATTFTLKPGTIGMPPIGGNVNGVVTYNAGTKTATLTPSSALAYSTEYTAVITTGVKDLAMNSLAGDYIWTFTTAAAGDAAPAAPTNVAASAGDRQNTVTWDTVTDAVSYNLYWSTTTGVTTASGMKSAGVVSPFVHTGISNGTTYHYVVTAVNGNFAESAISNEATATPHAAPAPAAPTNVAAAAGNQQNTITWTAVTNAVSYNLYWSTSPGVTTTSGTKIYNAVTPYVHTGLTNGTPYYYVATAVNANYLESAISSQATATPNNAPPPLP